MNFKIASTLMLLALPSFVLGAQEKRQSDTTKMYNLKDVVVTATKSERKIFEIPSRINLVPQFVLKGANITSADDMLKGISGLFVSRNFGIFDKNANISARGVGKEQARTLIMLDGVPLNKLSTGSANISLINTLNIDRIEVVKGPNSNIYGGNSMGGTVNYISSPIKDKIGVKAELDYGSYGTASTRVAVTGTTGNFFAGAHGFLRKSDGYIAYMKQDSSTIRMFLDEKIAGGFAGYRLKNGEIRFDYNFADALRGKGDRLYAKGGVIDGNNRYFSQNYRFGYKANSANASWGVTAFLNTENFNEIKWKGSDIFDVRVKRRDYGVWMNYNYTGFKNHSLGFGAEFKGGYVDGSDVYRTTTDLVKNKGEASSYSFYVQDEILLGKGFRLMPSLRADFARVGDGGFYVENGTSITTYLLPYTGNLDGKQHFSLSPKIALGYNTKGGDRAYLSYSRGFRHGSLEDMCRSGMISGGVILANTQLNPEYINTVEVGGDITLLGGIIFTPSIYYSLGTDFIYAVNTGQKIKINGKDRALLSLKNIGEVEIFGAEADVNYSPIAGVDINANYTYTKSTIKKYSADPQFNTVDITGKYLTYTPMHMLNLSATYRNKFLSGAIYYRYTSSQFMDSGNAPDTDKYINNIPALSYTDVKIWKNLSKDIVLNFGINNLFDRQYLDNSFQYSLGRYVYARLNITLKY